MSERVVLVSVLQDGVSHETYEDFVRRVLLPMARKLPSVQSYEVTALRELVEDSGEPSPGDYIDFIEVSNLEDYGRDLEQMLGTDAGKTFEDRWQAYVARYVSLRGEKIE